MTPRRVERSWLVWFLSHRSLQTAQETFSFLLYLNHLPCSQDSNYRWNVPRVFCFLFWTGSLIYAVTLYFYLARVAMRNGPWAMNFLCQTGDPGRNPPSADELVGWIHWKIGSGIYTGSKKRAMGTAPLTAARRDEICVGVASWRGEHSLRARRWVRGTHAAKTACRRVASLSTQLKTGTAWGRNSRIRGSFSSLESTQVPKSCLDLRGRVHQTLKPEKYPWPKVLICSHPTTNREAPWLRGTTKQLKEREMTGSQGARCLRASTEAWGSVWESMGLSNVGTPRVLTALCP